MEKKYNYIAIILLFAFISVATLFHPGFPPTHDGEYHVIRFYEFYKVLSEGIIYPRWAPDLNNGYGIPLFNYVYPLPNYVAALFHLFGMGFIDSFKMNMIVATIVGGLFFYLWTKIFWGNQGAIVSAIFYLFSPYRFVDIYVRGSIGELWALAFFPGFLWSITNYLKEKRPIYFISSCFLLSLIIFSHNILALMFFSFSIIYVLFYIFIIDKRNIKNKLQNAPLVFLVGIGISSIFWFPALAEKDFVEGLQIYDIGKNFPEFYQLIIPSWGTGFAGEDLSTLMSYQIGVANLLIVLISIFILPFYFKKKDNEHFIISAFFLVFFFLIFFLMLKQSSFIWHSIPLMKYFQFPWRFLSLEIIITSFLSGSIVYIYKRKIIAGLLIGITVFLSIGYTKIAYYHDRNDNYYISRSNFIDSTNSAGNVFNTRWMNRSLSKTKEKITAIDGKARIIIKSDTSTRLVFSYESETQSIILVNIAYFPGWEARLGNKLISLHPSKDGIIILSLPPSKDNVDIRLILTPAQRIGTSLSIISAGIILVFGFIKRRSLRVIS